MDKLHIAKDRQRLDQVVQNHYGSLERFGEVLAFNSHLGAVLKAGDRVFLPALKAKSSKKENALW